MSTSTPEPRLAYAPVPARAEAPVMPFSPTRPRRRIAALVVAVAGIIPLGLLALAAVTR